MRIRAAATALLAVAALGAGGCGGDAEDPIEQSVREQEKLAAQAATATTPAPAATTDDAPKGTATIQKLKISEDLKQKPSIAKPAGDPPSELYSRDIVKGKGKAAKKGDGVSVQYVGVSYATGEQFDASWDAGKAFEFNLGAQMVIPGWDQGVPGMREGGRRMLVIPPDLAYGAEGQPPTIAPNETLIFVIDLEKIG